LSKTNSSVSSSTSLFLPYFFNKSRPLSLLSVSSSITLFLLYILYKSLPLLYIFSLSLLLQLFSSVSTSTTIFPQFFFS
jgi:hypothetical protein